MEIADPVATGRTMRSGGRLFDMKSVFALGTALALALSAPASAATLAVGDGWTLFGFGATNSSIYDVATGDATYDFTLTQAALLDVTDAFDFGDTFSFSNFGVKFADTGAFDSIDYTNNPDIAFAGTSYSKGSFLLSAGTYSISGIATASPSGAGGSFIRLSAVPTAAVPEPATWGMMILGFGLIGGAMRRRPTMAAATA
jgi:hypothetical protein